MGKNTDANTNDSSTPVDSLFFEGYEFPVDAFPEHLMSQRCYGWAITEPNDEDIKELLTPKAPKKKAKGTGRAQSRKHAPA